MQSITGLHMALISPRHSLIHKSSVFSNVPTNMPSSVSHFFSFGLFSRVFYTPYSSDMNDMFHLLDTSDPY